ncbi:putative cytochrome P450 pisatin demethylase [Aspergillus clavatus NRRL 1]|uniref:Cytochrome P450 pisatin demethylase, putative n=1 Tax=Aspergillus clavatus (strain ATCC 1007 / CBS 513.65 / DSM 816 / NCTC 3887 / NRRL 1 / QM 1276 / 107) TaxID=344612 RepID=A1CPD7_ASPCL|nr:cytochrome P450 pisatin demethylase, putative [Aspergillus clavatus NRRL 1]EAW07508.1 cytochrome P450 pisatin demethylase, putative [Aspergillus clavatus NRRL 1]
MALATMLLSLALAACIARVVYLCYFHPLARYPGPWFARFTNAWRFVTFFGGQHHLIEQRLHAKYGRVVRVAPNWLSFSSSDDFEAIYGFNKAIEKSDFYDFGRDRGSRAESIFSTKTEAGHRVRKKKIVGPALTSSKISAYEPVIDKHVDILLLRLQSADPLPEPNGHGPLSVNMAPLVHQYTLDSMLELIFGPTLAAHPYTDTPAGDGICRTLRIMTKMAWSFSLWPAFGWLMNTRLVDAVLRRPTRNKQGVATGMAGLMGAVMPMLQKNPQQVTQSPQPSIVKNWLDIPASDANRMSPGEITADAFNMVIAGPGSTAAALTAVLYHLGSQHGQTWQEKIRDETRMPTVSSPALQAVIKETLRFSAAFPTAFPRVIRHGAETAIPGLPAPLPPGTMVSANTFVLGRSAEVWGDDAGQWAPQRWLGDEQQRREMEAKFVAFSKGSRSCIGRELALLVLASAVTGVVQRWRIRSQGALRGKSFLEMQYDECWMELEPVAL